MRSLINRILTWSDYHTEQIRFAGFLFVTSAILVTVIFGTHALVERGHLDAVILIVLAFLGVVLLMDTIKRRRQWNTAMRTWIDSHKPTTPEDK